MARRKIFTAVAALLFSVGSTASAAPTFNESILLNVGGWSVKDDLNQVNENFFFTEWIMNASGTLRVTDLYYSGDAFEVFRNGTSVGLTSSVSVDPTLAFNSDPDAAWLDALFSKGSFSVNANDVITVKNVQYPTGYTDGTVALSLTSVPEPGSVFLVSAGLVALGFVSRRRRA